MKSINNTFSKLCLRARQAYDEELEGISFESALLDILNYVKKNKLYKAQFVELFNSLLISKDSPYEAVAFCMRELRWPEVRDYATKIMNESCDPRVEALRSVVTAYEDEWPDADLYEYYS